MIGNSGDGNVADRGRMPVIFAGHGSPMNAIEDNRWSRGFAALGAHVLKPAAILAVSAHWYVDGTLLMANALPPTIHDFGGFPPALYEVDYPAPGQVDLARRVMRLLGEERAALDSSWGLDHGTWRVLRWMYPEADVPVIQLSIDRRLPESDDGRMAHPTADHWLPLIYAFGASDGQDELRFPAEGFDWGSISMRNVVLG